MKKTILALGLMAGLLMAGKSQAILIDRGNGLIYDDVLNITWTQTAGDWVQRNWADANTWAADLVFGGFSDWRLPYISVAAGAGPFTGLPVDCSTASEPACRDNEYGYMFYQNLNGTFPSDKTGNQLGDGGVTLNNISNAYWSGTEFDASSAWFFFFNFGGQGLGTKAIPNGLGWAVRPGDSVRVPEMGSGLLLGLGLMGLRLARRWRKA